MTYSTQIHLFQIFKQKFGEKEAEEIVEILENTIDQKLENTKDFFLTKNDKVELIKEIRDTKVDTIKWMVGLFLGLALMIIGLYIKK